MIDLYVLRIGRHKFWHMAAVMTEHGQSIGQDVATSAHKNIQTMIKGFVDVVEFFRSDMVGFQVVKHFSPIRVERLVARPANVLEHLGLLRTIEIGIFPQDSSAWIGKVV